jgi:hypothetical protein
MQHGATPSRRGVEPLDLPALPTVRGGQPHCRGSRDERAWRPAQADAHPDRIGLRIDFDEPSAAAGHPQPAACSANADHAAQRDAGSDRAWVNGWQPRRAGKDGKRRRRRLLASREDQNAASDQDEYAAADGRNRELAPAPRPQLLKLPPGPLNVDRTRCRGRAAGATSQVFDRDSGVPDQPAPAPQPQERPKNLPLRRARGGGKVLVLGTEQRLEPLVRAGLGPADGDEIVSHAPYPTSAFALRPDPQASAHRRPGAWPGRRPG